MCLSPSIYFEKEKLNRMNMKNQKLENPSLHPLALNHQELAVEILEQIPILRDRIEEKCGIQKEQVVESLMEVIRFLNLIAFAHQKLTPSLAIDYIWHEFILCTRAYASFCETVFGRYIHHFPGGSKEENQNQYRQTLKLYQVHFGSPPTKYWGENQFYLVESNCGPCEAELKEGEQHVF